MKHTKIISYGEFAAQYPEIAGRYYRNHDYNRFCKADRLHEMVVGTYVFPVKENLSEEKITFGFCFTADALLLVDDSGFTASILEKMESYKAAETSESAAQDLYEFLEFLLKDDMMFLQRYEEMLAELEDALLENGVEGFERKILNVRKELAAIGAYYDQLSDVGETLCADATEAGNDKYSQLFSLYSNKAERMYATVQMLKEYSMQLREMRQSQIDMRQNEIMKVLTIVTTIIMPLTLVAGWYGMNFAGMPELSAKHAYPIVTGICIFCIVVEVILFKIKKWF